MTGNAWQADLHPRDTKGEFANKPGGGGWAGKLSDKIGQDLAEVQVSDLQREKQGIKLPHPEGGDHLYQTSVPNSNLTPDDHEAVYKYAWDASNFERMNGALRGDKSRTVPKPLADDVKALTGALGRNYLKKPTIVYRGMPDTPQNRKLFSRASYVDNGFMSTSTDPDVADLSADPAGSGGGIIVKLRLPTGTKAISIGNMFETKGGYDQKEILLQRGSKIRIISKREINGVLHVEAELISQSKPQ